MTLNERHVCSAYISPEKQRKLHFEIRGYHFKIFVFFRVLAKDFIINVIKTF